MTCNCIKNVLEEMRNKEPEGANVSPENTELHMRVSDPFNTTQTWPSMVVRVRPRKEDGSYERGRTVKVVARFCPVCGKPYRELTEEVVTHMENVAEEMRDEYEAKKEAEDDG